MQRTMLAAVHATEEQLITPRYMTQMCALLTFSYIKRELFALKNTCHHVLDASYSEKNTIIQ